MAGKKKSAKKAKKDTGKKAKIATTKTRVTPPHSGQSGPPLELSYSKLNEKEARLVSVLGAEVNPLPLNALAATCWPDKASSTKDAERNQANSWVRNSLRRLVRGKWVEKVGKGTYRLSDTGRNNSVSS